MPDEARLRCRFLRQLQAVPQRRVALKPSRPDRTHVVRLPVMSIGLPRPENRNMNHRSSITYTASSSPTGPSSASAHPAVLGRMCSSLAGGHYPWRKSSCLATVKHKRQGDILPKHTHLHESLDFVQKGRHSIQGSVRVLSRCDMIPQTADTLFQLYNPPPAKSRQAPKLARVSYRVFPSIRSEFRKRSAHIPTIPLESATFVSCQLQHRNHELPNPTHPETDRRTFASYDNGL